MGTPRDTSKALAAPHRLDCACVRCIGRRRRAGIQQPPPRVQTDAVLIRRAKALERRLYTCQRAVRRAERLLAQVMPGQRAPGKPGDPMQAIRDWKAADSPDDWPDTA